MRIKNKKLKKMTDAELMLVIFEACIDGQMVPGRGSPCHKRIKKILKKAQTR